MTLLFLAMPMCLMKWYGCWFGLEISKLKVEIYSQLSTIMGGIEKKDK